MSGRPGLPEGLPLPKGYVLPCPSGASGWLSGKVWVGPGVPAPALAPQGLWNRMAAACQLGTVTAPMPRATFGPQGASTRMPATTAHAKLGSSSARLSPARLPPIVPGAAGRPGVPAATHVGPEGSRAASGMGLAGLEVPSATQGLTLQGTVSLLTESSWVLLSPATAPPQTLGQLCPWLPWLFLSCLHAHPEVSRQGVSPEDRQVMRGLGHLSPPLPWPHPGPPRQAHGPRSVGRNSPRASAVLSPRAHPCACRALAPAPWGTAGCTGSASSGECRAGSGAGTALPESSVLSPGSFPAPAPRRV